MQSYLVKLYPKGRVIFSKHGSQLCCRTRKSQNDLDVLEIDVWRFREDWLAYIFYPLIPRRTRNFPAGMPERGSAPVTSSYFTKKILSILRNPDFVNMSAKIHTRGMISSIHSLLSQSPCRSKKDSNSFVIRACRERKIPRLVCRHTRGDHVGRKYYRCSRAGYN